MIAEPYLDLQSGSMNPNLQGGSSNPDSDVIIL